MRKLTTSESLSVQGGIEPFNLAAITALSCMAIFSFEVLFEPPEEVTLSFLVAAFTICVGMGFFL